MQYFLIKSEPDTYSFEQLQADGRTRWDGIRNYQARNNLRSMRPGDLCLFYHSNIGLEVVGIARAAGEPYADPTAEKGDWSAIDMEPVQPLARAIPLTEIKNHPGLQHLGLVRNGRLSVMPVTFDEFSILLALGETQL